MHEKIEKEENILL